MSEPVSEWYENLSPYGRQDFAAMQARVYAMSDEERDRWYAAHPLSMYGEPEDAEGEM